MSRRWKINSIDVFIRRQPRTVLIIGILIFIYTGYLLGRAVFANYQINKQIKQLEKDITGLEQQNSQLKNYIAFYKTSDYQEKILRQKLGYQKPGETVVATPKDNPVANRVIKTATEQVDQNRPNWQKWISFFTD